MKILLVEDEPNVSSFIKKGLDEQGYNTQIAEDGETALQLVDKNPFDIIILDRVLPGMDGVDVCRKIRSRKNSQMGILMLSALGTTDEIVIGLDSGADDYLSKPFRFQELDARIRALGRRQDGSKGEKILEVADLSLNLETRTATRNGKEIILTNREYLLLEFFLRNKGKVVSRMDILEKVWEVNFNPGTNVVDVYVNYLRKKIDKGFHPRLIHTKVGMGYILKEES